jgi:hypothetical protein
MTTVEKNDILIIPSIPGASQTDIVEYLGSMSATLAKVARMYDLPVLAHLYDMAALEADQLLKKLSGE